MWLDRENTELHYGLTSGMNFSNQNFFSRSIGAAFNILATYSSEMQPVDIPAGKNKMIQLII